MAYVKNNWVDQEVERPKTYEMTNNADGSVTLIDSFGLVTELGTPVNADNMNHIEEGIAGCDLRKFDLSETYEKGEWVTGIVDKEKGIYESLTNNNYGNSLTDDTKWKKVELGGSGTGGGFNLFDLIQSDHILEGDEAVGKALLGTYVYKTAVSGIRDGYPDFYNRCVKEYKNATELISLQNNVTISGNLSTNNGIFSGFSSGNYLNTLSNFAPGSQPWEMGFKVNTGTAWATSDTAISPIIGGNNEYVFSLSLSTLANNRRVTWSISSNRETYDIIDDKLTDFIPELNRDYWFKLSYNGISYNLYVSKDGVTFTLIDTVESSTPVVSSTVPLRLGINRGSAAFWTGSIDLKECYIKINNQLWWQGSTVIYKNANGHIFYDIADKILIDDLYNKYGIAWYYGVDEENERIFLPRKDLVSITPKDTLNVYGDKNGLMFGNADASEAYYLSTSNSYNNSKPLYLSNNKTGTTKVGGAVSITTSTAHIGTAVAYGIATKENVTKAGSNSAGLVTDTFKKDINTFIYMVVGNTKEVSVITDVTEVTTSENDTLPLFTPMYFDYKPNNVSWIKAGQQVNSGGIYTFVYNELVNELTNPKYGLKVIEANDKVAGVDYSEYWVVSQDFMSFTTPSKISYKALNGGIKGNGKTFCITDGTNNYGITNSSSAGLVRRTGAYNQNIGYATTANTSTINDVTFGVVKNSATSGIIAEESTAQLYFKVANAVQNLELMDAGKVMETLADKVDADGSNAQFPYIKKTYTKGTSGYILYSNGYCLQWGEMAIASKGTTTITFLIPYKNTGYWCQISDITGTNTSAANSHNTAIVNKLATGLSGQHAETATTSCWVTGGYTNS